MMGWLLEPLTYPFMVRGLIASLLVGTVCAVLGTYVVLKGMAFFGDALAHAILPGVAVAYLAGWPLFAGALVTGIGVAVGIGYLTRRGRIKEDTAIGILFSGAFALGIALLSTVEAYTVDLTHFLFGNVLGVSPADLWTTGALGGIVLLLVAALYKEFLVMAFDPVLAQVLRLPTTFLHYLLLVMLAATVVVALQTVGVALTVAMLVTPAATAYLLTRRLLPMMALAAFLGSFSAVAGLSLSFSLNVASGPAVVLICTALFLLALFFSPRRGVVWGWLRRAEG
ncbi:MAG TPA: metal ABC transporter permease [Chloroflexi bacterium]|nr:metal ABC transporter permease [Chloroflexota bacterium]